MFTGYLHCAEYAGRDANGEYTAVSSVKSGLKQGSANVTCEGPHSRLLGFGGHRVSVVIP